MSVSKWTIAFALATAVSAGSSVGAHRQDELLQAARLEIQSGRVQLELDLTPGVAVAETMIGEIDVDRDGVLSVDEQKIYVERVVRAIELHVDGRSLRLASIASTFPNVDSFRGGEGTIQLKAAVDLPHLRGGDHQLHFRNAFRREMSVYLANALAPESDRIAVTSQRRDQDQHDLTIQYNLRGDRVAATPWLLFGIIGAAVMAFLRIRPNPGLEPAARRGR